MRAQQAEKSQNGSGTTMMSGRSKVFTQPQAKATYQYSPQISRNCSKQVSAQKPVRKSRKNMKNSKKLTTTPCKPF